MGLLDNKVAFITGAASGIGARMARRFAHAAARIALAAVQAAEGEQLRTDLEAAGGAAAYVEGDVRDPDAVHRALAATVERFGQLDSVRERR